ncbi:PREDICTED: pentatricopeptide repeat-containing protein At5g61400 [Tarenaya hassleriana]|uniref:pentatricopeptide repeat-containing protein At5g61400 n=1 Tax=Tarenaya hassleriana TaxID=28532 RepID=UPI00053C5470|nr:PREDICTED: pentatricopeptide repeat-containing protein At5g61400 [Tarenaya hassleriana]
MLKLLLSDRRRLAYSYKLQSSAFRSFSHSPCPSSLASLSSSSATSDLVEAILNCRSAEEAVKLFESSSGPVSSKTKDLRPFSATVHLLTSAQKYAQARCLIKSLIQGLCRNSKPTNVGYKVFNALKNVESPRFSNGVFNLLVMELLEMGLFEEALSVIRKMRCSPDLKTCHAILNGLVKRKQFHSVWEVYQHMISHGLVPDAHIYSVLFDCCSKQGYSSRKEKLLKGMATRGIQPNVVIYTLLIRDLCKKEKMEEAEKMFQLMKEHGILPNLYTYGTMINGYCKASQLRPAYALYKEIPVSGLLPNVFVLGILVDGFCKVHELTNARSLFVHMVKFGVDPNLFVYNSLINGYCGLGNMSEALGLCSEMKSLKLSPDVVTYSILIKGLLSQDQLEEAHGLFQTMKDEKIVPNSVTYNSLIHGHCKEGNMEKALELSSEMTAFGIEPNIITFSTLIDGYCKACNMKAAMGLYSEMIIKGIAPDVVTYTALIDGHFKDANMKEAIRLYNEMLETGICPNSYTFACLVDGLWKEGQLSKATDFILAFREDNSEKTNPRSGLSNHVAYTSLIHGLCQNGYILRATRFFSDMRSVGLNPDVSSYVSMVKGHLKEKRITDVMMLHCDMIKTGMLPNLVVSQLLARGYQENSYLRSAWLCANDTSPILEGSKVLKNRV